MMESEKNDNQQNNNQEVEIKGSKDEEEAMKKENKYSKVKTLNINSLNSKKVEEENAELSSARNNERRFQEEKEQKEREEINNKIKESREKNLKSIIKKITTITEVMVKKKIKIVDLIIAFLVLFNLLLALVENNYYTASISEVICGVNPNSTNTTNSNETTTIGLRNLIDNGNYYPYNNYNENEFYKRALATSNNSNCFLQNYTKITKESYQNNNTTEMLRWIMVGVVSAMELLLLYRYKLKLNLLRSSFLACSKDNFFTTGLWKSLLLEFIILAILSPPKMEGVIKGRMLFGAYIYSYDSIITFFVLFKLYYFIRIYGHLSIWASERVVQIGVDNKISIGAQFAFKAQIKNTPYISMFFMLAVSIGIFGFMMRIFEYGYTSDPGAAVSAKAVNNPNFKSYTDTFWVIIITMMTVGYGDIYPQTHMGRVIAFLSALVGMTIVSLLIVSLSYVVEFSPEEKKAHNLIRKMQANEEMKKFSATYVKAILKLYLLKKSDAYYYKRKITKRFAIFLDQLMLVKEIGVQFNKFRKVASTQSIPTDEILSQLDKKLEKDTNYIGPQKFLLSDLTEMTRRIIYNEQHINNAVNYLKEKQDDLASYLVKFNAIKTGKETFNHNSNNDFLISE